MSWGIDDLVGWAAVGATELGLALGKADTKTKAAVRSSVAIGLACAGNSAAVGAAVTAAVSIADCVMEECGVDGKIRQAVSVAGSAVGTVCSAGASTASLVSAGAQVTLYAAGEAMDAAGVEGASGQVMQSLAAGVSMNAGEAIAKNVGGVVGVGVAAGVHKGTGGKDEDLLKAMAAGYSTGASVGGAAGSIAENAVVDVSATTPEAKAQLNDAIASIASDKQANAGWNDPEMTLAERTLEVNEQIETGPDPFGANVRNGIVELAGEAAGAGVAVAVHARSKENSRGRSSFLDAYGPGRALGKTAASAAVASVDEIAQIDKSSEAAASATKTALKLVTELSSAGANVVRQTEFQAKADYEAMSAKVYHWHAASLRGQKLSDTGARISDATSQADTATAALTSGIQKEQQAKERRAKEQMRVESNRLTQQLDLLAPVPGAEDLDALTWGQWQRTA